MDFLLVNSEDQLADTFDKGRVTCQAGVSIYALKKLGIQLEGTSAYHLIISPTCYITSTTCCKLYCL